MNPPSNRENLEAEYDELRSRVFAGMEAPALRPLLTAAYDPENPAHVDPELARFLQAIFQDRREGRLEALRIETDALRRITASREPQSIFRPFGVMELCIPVRRKGVICHAIFSGPIKIGPWTPRELQTLARVSGVAEGRFPPGLLGCQTFSESWVNKTLREQLEARALVLEHALDALEGPEGLPTPAGSTGGASRAMDMLYSGLPDHLDALFSAIAATSRGMEPEREATLLRSYAHRGALLLQDLMEARDQERARVSDCAVHAMLDDCIEALRTEFPRVHFSDRWQAERDTIRCASGAVAHLTRTLLTAVADGLGSSGGTVGIATRNTRDAEQDCLQIEIRDGGGMATFAGVEPVLDQILLQEQNDLADEFADWAMLAERLDARIRIQTEEQIVTKVDLFLPMQGREADAPMGDASPTNAEVWLVEDDPGWTHSLRDILSESRVNLSHLSSGSALQEFFSTASLPADLIIVDMHLGDIRGDELRHWIYEQDPELPVILMSSMAGTHAGIQRATELRNTLFLQKPFSDDELRNLVSITLADTIAEA